MNITTACYIMKEILSQPKKEGGTNMHIKKWVGGILFLLLFCSSTLPAKADVPTTYQKRELRAAWIASVYNIDWPSQPGLPVEQQKKSLPIC